MHKSLINQFILQFPEEFKDRCEDISAILLISEQFLFLGSDETATLERLSLQDDRTFANHKHFDVADFIELPGEKDQEIDIEGLDYSDGYIWLVGSHSWKRKKPKDTKSDRKNIERLATVESGANRYILARIPLVQGELYQSCSHPDVPDKKLTAAQLQLTKTSNILIDALKEDPHLGDFVTSKFPSKDNGFDIEGLGIYQNRVFLGLRGPVLRGWAILLELELEESSPTILTLKPIGENKQLYKKHFLSLNGLGIRDLCFDGEDMLILAGPTMDLDGPVRLYRLKDALNLPEETLFKPDPVLDIPYGEGEDHAEGITLFDAIAKEHSLLVVYDTPAKETRLVGESAVKADVFNLTT